MALDRNNLLTLAKTLAKAKPSSAVAYSYDGNSYSYEALNETFRKEMNELAGTYALYRENKNFIFSLMEQVVDEILPQRVLERYGDFAEVRTFAQGDKPIFKRKLGKMRAKQFITKVGLAGMYEVFKLGSETFEVPTNAVGGAAQIGFEEFLDNRVDFAEMTEIIMAGLDEIVYREIARALVASLNQLPAANKVAAAGFDEAGMDRLIAVSSAYGPPTIYCTYEFAVKILPEEGWISDNMRDTRWAQGHLGNYKGHRVVILPQSFEDETNAQKVIDPGYAWIIPDGGDGRPVKIALEGNTIIDEYTNYDRSREIQVYRKVGVVVMMTNNICSYVDTQLQGKLDTITMFQP